MVNNNERKVGQAPAELMERDEAEDASVKGQGARREGGRERGGRKLVSVAFTHHRPFGLLSVCAVQ